MRKVMECHSKKAERLVIGNINRHEWITETNYRKKCGRKELQRKTEIKAHPIANE